MFDLQVRQSRTYKFDNVELKFDFVELISSTFQGGAKKKGTGSSLILCVRGQRGASGCL